MTAAVHTWSGQRAAEDAPAAPRPRHQPSALDHRPHLDGLRAVAVYLVVVFHAGADRAAGGFIGVDVFFVLSGYLVTRVLVRDLHGAGRIDFRRFYSRRVRRLLPAALVVLLVTMVVFSSVGAQAELRDAQGAVRAAALYVSNWFFIARSDQYFGSDLAGSPVLHFWSLSVEEQFYVAWPIALAGLHLIGTRFGAHGRRVVQGTVLAGAVASLAAALWFARTDVDRAYYGTDTRAYQLLGGAALALAPGLLVRVGRRPLARRALPLVALGGLGGLLVLASDVIEVSPVTRGVAAAASSLALIAALEATSTGVVRGVLSRPTVVYLGQVSYGTYLWHWLVILVTTRVVGAGPLSTAVVAVVVATALAALSFELLERPVRTAPSLDRRRVAVVAAGVAASVAVGVLAVPGLLDPSGGRAPAPVAQGTARGATPVPPDLDWKGAQDDVADFPTCTAADVARCTLVQGRGPHVLVIGDSHARVLIPMLSALARAHDLSFSAAVAPVCPWQAGLQYLKRTEECRDHQSDWYPTVVDQLDPDVVVVAHRTFDDPASSVRLLDEDLGELRIGTAAGLDAIRQRTVETLRRFSAAGRASIIVEPVPVAPRGSDPLLCLSGATYVDECRFVSQSASTPIEQIYRDIAATEPRVWTLDLDRRACPYLPICDPIVDGLIVRRDDTHLTTRFADTLTGAVEALLLDIGVLDRPPGTGS